MSIKAERQTEKICRGTRATEHTRTQAGRQAGWQAGTQEGRQAGRQAGTQAGRQAGRQAGTGPSSSEPNKLSAARRDSATLAVACDGCMSVCMHENRKIPRCKSVHVWMDA